MSSMITRVCCQWFPRYVVYDYQGMLFLITRVLCLWLPRYVIYDYHGESMLSMITTVTVCCLWLPGYFFYDYHGSLSMIASIIRKVIQLFNIIRKIVQWRDGYFLFTSLPEFMVQVKLTHTFINTLQNWTCNCYTYNSCCAFVAAINVPLITVFLVKCVWLQTLTISFGILCLAKGFCVGPTVAGQ